MMRKCKENCGHIYILINLQSEKRELSQRELSNKGKMMRKCKENCGNIYILINLQSEKRKLSLAK
jgi:hypothetical protein